LVCSIDKTEISLRKADCVTCDLVVFYPFFSEDMYWKPIEKLYNKNHTTHRKLIAAHIKTNNSKRKANSE